jgi:AcrR family transcriptional regulator
MNIQSEPGILSRKDREKLRNRKAILEAAVHLFAENGFAETKLEDVAALAEFGKGTLYNYFENKHDLLLSAFDYAMDKVVHYLVQQLEHVSDPLDRIRLIVDSQFEYYHSHADFLRVVMSNQQIIKQCQDEKAAKNLHQRFQGLRQLLVDEIQAGMDAGKLKSGDANRYASYLSSMIHGQMRSLNAGEMQLNDVHPHEIMDIFLYGVRNV